MEQHNAQVRPRPVRFGAKKLPAPVAKGLSARADTDRRSLLDLPAELRNKIYALVFHNKVDRITGPEHRRYTPGDCSNATFTYAGPYPDISLFYTCRQVYHETVSMFYAAELVEVIPCDMHYTITSKRFEKYYADITASLLRFGSQLPLLRKIWIDLGNDHADNYPDDLFSDTLRDLVGEMNIAPLLLLLWNIPHLFELQYTKTGLAVSPPSAVLLGLYRDDLGLKKYKRLVASIDIDRGGSGGSVTYKGSDGGSHSDSRRRFSALEGGKRLEFQRKVPELLNLDKQIVSRILKNAVCPPEGVVVDLDMQNNFGPAIALLVTNKWMRGLTENSFWNKNVFNLKLSSSEPRTSFSSFGAFKKWFCHGSPSSLPYAGTKLKKPIEQIMLKLDFSSSRVSRLENLRIGITDFILATSHAHAKSEGRDYVCMCVTLAGLEHTISLDQLRIDLLVFLAKLIDVYPNIKAAKCPEIWINGFGEVADFRFPGTSNIQNSFPVVGRPGKNYHSMVRYAPYPNDQEYVKSPFNGTTGCFFRYLSEAVQQKDQRTANAAAQKYFGMDFEPMMNDVSGVELEVQEDGEGEAAYDLDTDEEVERDGFL
ncbi:hypothetical protein BDV96DRAFT_297480 [Lophiotrema nucula]|uniref:Uncharacterized protein n=1 Tax=Lophiotrema nucula TaxID=690887 RepID=A0A6A5YKX7_9PLEO|nr:hypothetical protein BDV96DRAFT_297480 [Lophiotrema nucula]